MKGLRLIATGRARPSRAVLCRLSRTVDTSDEWITTRTGIHQRCTGKRRHTIAATKARRF